MAKRMHEYTPAGVQSTNASVALRLTQTHENDWPMFELINLSTNRPIAFVEPQSKVLREGDPRTVGFRKSLDVLLTQLNMHLLTPLEAYAPVPA